VREAVSERRLSESIKHPIVIAVIAAMLGILANSIVAAIAQNYALQIEDRRDRREVVLQLLREGDTQRTLESLRLLDDSGLLPDPGKRLEHAVAASRIGVSCDVTLAGPPPKIGRNLTGDARTDSALLANQVLAYQRYTEALRTILESCGAKFKS